MTDSGKGIIPITMGNYDLSLKNMKSLNCTYSELNETTLPLPLLDWNFATNAVSMPYALGVTSNPYLGIQLILLLNCL